MSREPKSWACRVGIHSSYTESIAFRDGGVEVTWRVIRCHRCPKVNNKYAAGRIDGFVMGMSGQ